MSNLIDCHKSHNPENWVVLVLVFFSNSKSLILKHMQMDPHEFCPHIHWCTRQKNSTNSLPPATHRKTHKPSLKGHNRAPIHNFSAQSVQLGTTHMKWNNREVNTTPYSASGEVDKALFEWNQGSGFDGRRLLLSILKRTSVCDPSLEKAVLMFCILDKIL